MNKKLITLLSLGLGIAVVTATSAAIGTSYFSIARKSIRQVKLTDPKNIHYRALGLVKKDVGQYLTSTDIVNLGFGGKGIDLMQFVDTTQLPKEYDYTLTTTPSSKANDNGSVTNLVFTAFQKDQSGTIVDTFEIPEQIGYKQSPKKNNLKESELSFTVFKLSKNLNLTLKDSEETRSIFGLASSSDSESTTKTIDQVIASLNKKFTSNSPELISQELSKYLNLKFDSSLLSYKQKLIFGSGKSNNSLFRGSLANGDLEVSVTLLQVDETNTGEGATTELKYKPSDIQLYIPLKGYRAARFDSVVNSLSSKLDLLSLVIDSTAEKIQQKQQEIIAEIFTIKQNTKLNTVTAQAASQNIKEYLTSLNPTFEKRLNIDDRYKIEYKVIPNSFDNSLGTLQLSFIITPTISIKSNTSLIDNQKGFDISNTIYGFKPVNNTATTTEETNPNNGTTPEVTPADQGAGTGGGDTSGQSGSQTGNPTNAQQGGGTESGGTGGNTVASGGSNGAQGGTPAGGTGGSGGSGTPTVASS